MYLTLYYIVTRLPDSLRSVSDHFLSVCPTSLTVDLLEERLLAAQQSIVAVGASRGDPRTPVFQGCSPPPLLPSVASAAAADLGGFESVGAASAPSGRRRPGKGKGGRGAGGAGRGGGGGGGGGSGGGGGGGGRGGGGGGVGSSSGGGGGGGGGGSGGAGHGSTQRSGSGGGPRQEQQRSRETPSSQQLRNWYAGRQRGGGAGPCTYVLRTGDRAGEHDEGDCYLCLPPDPGGGAAALGACEAAALGASASASLGAGGSALSGTASAQVFHTFTLDSGASRSFFRDRTTLTPLSRPVAVSLADPSGGPVLASFSTVLPCSAAPSGTLSGLYLPSFSTNLCHVLTDLGEQPRSPPILYVDNKAMLALCREHRLEHRTKHIALRYFLARELQQRGQLCLAYVASQANTADIFTKALPPGDHQRFCTMLACFALLDWSCDLLFSPTLPIGVFLLVPNSLLVQSFLFLHRLPLPGEDRRVNSER
ncbi:unnamed protein product [Closterium sp. NIES-53]